MSDDAANRPAHDADRPSRHGAILGEALAVLCEVGRREAPMPIPDPCLTCAFRKGSMPNQAAGTGMVALNCVLGIDRDHFACHQGMRDGEPRKLCVGYVAALLAPWSTTKEVVAAFRDVLDEADGPDLIRAAFDAWLDKADPTRRMDVYEAARAYAKHVAEKHRPGRDLFGPEG